MFRRKIEKELIEVKATNGNTKSARIVIDDDIKYPYVKNMIKLCDKNISYANNCLKVPYYLAFLIK